ncbi:MAG TPA: hypothetical protein PKM27_12475 [Saprospiraceae bacterium]|nr:hypothetical protein [Saprospiraceae bacterium]HNT19998.1 hypothetical protein [Saprospiraceae bacterium]
MTFRKDNRVPLKAIGFLGYFFLAWCTNAQSSFSGTFEGKINGDPARMELVQQGDGVTGKYHETGNTFDIRAKAEGKDCRGSLLISGTEIALATFNFRISETGLRLTILLPDQSRVEAEFVRLAEPSKQPAGPFNHEKTLTAAQDGLPRDPAVVGRWMKEDILNSGTGTSAASLVTVYYLSLYEDGRFIQEKARSAGGTDWSSIANRTTDLTGHWYTQNQVMYVRPAGEKEYLRLHPYLFHNGALVFKTEDGKYLIWNKQN